MLKIVAIVINKIVIIKIGFEVIFHLVLCSSDTYMYTGLTCYEQNTASNPRITEYIKCLNFVTIHVLFLSFVVDHVMT